MKQSFLRKPLLLAASLLTLAGSLAIADHEWEFVRTMSGSLNDGYYRTHAITLYRGYDYYFGGACDGDCLDLDLVLKDASGRVIARDTARDDEPELNVEIYQTGTFYLEAHMADCWAQPCRYEVDQYER